jgi:hypothetical protein
MAFNHLRSQASASRIIQRWGGAGYLVRAGVRRPIICARLEYNAKERGLFQDGAERILVSAKGLTIAPDQNLDTVIFAKREYRIVEPPLGPRPAGIVIFYDLSVIFTQDVTT